MATTYVDDDARQYAARFSRGAYQADLAAGSASWCGYDIGGSAQNWGASYRRSRDGLVARWEKAGLKVTFDWCETRKGWDRVALVTMTATSLVAWRAIQAREARRQKRAENKRLGIPEGAHEVTLDDIAAMDAAA